MSPMGALLRGLVAGAAGTLAMDAVLYSRYRHGGGKQPPLEWEFSTPPDWERVPAPGQVGRRLAEGFTQHPLPASLAPVVNGIMHWSYGLAWGAAYGIAAGSAGRPRAWLGLPFGTLVFLTDYVVLPASGLYKPIWEYDGRTLWRDLSAHLAFGAGASSVFRLLARL